MIIWALFDSETHCVSKALPEHEVYSFGIGTGTEHIPLDLSDFETARKELDKYPRPDVIFASPPCETWVPLNVGTKRFYTREHGLNFYWKKRWEPFDFTEKAKARRINGMKTAQCTTEIIKHYKPDFFAIENGSLSLIFDYMATLGFIGNRNRCNYYSYGLDVLKPTIMLSNKILNLKQDKPNRKLLTINNLSYKSKREMRAKYGNISQVPPALYQDIMRQFLERQRDLFTLTQKEAV